MARSGERDPLAFEWPNQMFDADELVVVGQTFRRQAVEYNPAARVGERLHLGGIIGQQLQIGR